MLREIEPVTNMLWSKYAMGREIPYSDTDLLEAIHPLINLLNGQYRRSTRNWAGAASRSLSVRWGSG